MFKAPHTPHLVGFDGQFSIAETPTGPPASAPNRKRLKTQLAEQIEALKELQEVLYASDRVALLLVFQAMDAAGKDGTIRKVMTGINPAGCQVTSFKKPSHNELDHDFLWRCQGALPERGRIGIFNRSWYEEVLVVRVHPTILESQKLPWAPSGDALWTERMASIHDHERHLARNGTVILKFFLHVSRDVQRERLVDRIDEPDKNWKFAVGDVRERSHWDAYMSAYEEALRATSRPWAPWYAIPADDKRYMRLAVARTVTAALSSLDLRFPTLDPDVMQRLGQMRAALLGD